MLEYEITTLDRQHRLLQLIRQYGNVNYEQGRLREQVEGRKPSKEWWGNFQNKADEERAIMQKILDIVWEDHEPAVTVVQSSTILERS